jgi:hypothetical protein
MARRYIKGKMVEVADTNTQAVLRKLHPTPGEACDVCGEVVTTLYPALPGQPQVVDFTEHNRQAYDLHLRLTDQEHLRDQPITRSYPTSPCPCECNSGSFCGGCGHAGCGRR